MSTLPRKDVRAALTLSLDPTTADARIRAVLEAGGLAVDVDPMPMPVVQHLLDTLGPGVSAKRARKRLLRLMGPEAAPPEPTRSPALAATPRPAASLPPAATPPPTAQPSSPTVPDPTPPELTPEEVASEPTPEEVASEPTFEEAASERPTPAIESLAVTGDATDTEVARPPRASVPVWLLLAIAGVVIVIGVILMSGGDEPEPAQTEETAPPEIHAPIETADVTAEPTVDLPPFDAALVELSAQAQSDALDKIDAELIVLLSPEEFATRRREWIQRQLDVQKLYGEELALQTIGLMPEQFHYPQFLQDMLCQPVAHYFDEEAGVVYRTRDGLAIEVDMEAIPPRPLRLASVPTGLDDAAEAANPDEGGDEPEAGDEGADDDFGAPGMEPDPEPEAPATEEDDDPDAVPDDDVVDPSTLPMPPVPAPFPFRPLVYALQYQHFDLASREELNQRGTLGNDQALTMMAVMQGDAFATWLDLQRPDIDIWSPEGVAAIDELEARVDASGALVGMPEFLARVAKFPELEGARWTLHQMRTGITHTALFESLPTSTGDILHPERAPGTLVPETIDVTLPYKYLGVTAENVVYDGVLGEFGLVAWLELVGLRANGLEITNGWRGDRLWCVAIGRKALVVHASVWADEKAARAFEDAVRLLYVQRYGPVYNYRARVLRRGNAVVWMEGILPGDLTKMALKTTINQLVPEPDEVPDPDN